MVKSPQGNENQEKYKSNEDTWGEEIKRAETAR